ncbi:MAG: hypothetical protein LBL74_02970 [Bacteroidales bacterium]|nr:hypothetical protein [Bacteroidales bacterium]
MNENKLDEAKTMLEEIITANQADDTTYYMLGNVFRRSNDWQQAINNYTLAIEINAQSPAVAAREMAISILNFYNTDMYNH